MPRNTSGLKRGGSPGRRKGVPNKATVEIREAARAIVEDAKGRKRLLMQYRAGRLAPPLVQMLFHYAYGKPKEMVEHSGPDGQPVPVRVVFGGRYRPSPDEGA